MTPRRNEVSETTSGWIGRWARTIDTLVETGRLRYRETGPSASSNRPSATFSIRPFRCTYCP